MKTNTASSVLPSWYRPRGYAHFDTPISLRGLERYLKSPNKIARHSFFPFIKYQSESFKLTKDSAGNLKTKKKSRPIAYASHVDSHIFSYYCYLLSQKYELQLSQHRLEESVLAFRSLGKSNIHFANDAFEVIKSYGSCIAFATDITGFFDNIDHRLLKDRWKNLLEVTSLPEDHYAVWKAITNYSYVERDQVYDLFGLSKTNPPSSPQRICSVSEFRSKVRNGKLIHRHKNTKGIPQGSPISALLSNIYMIDFDIDMLRYANSLGGKYYRYCDDVLLIIPGSVTGIFESVEDSIEVHTKTLSVNIDKTDTRTYTLKNGELISDKPLQYLGFTFDGKRKLLRSSGLAGFSNKMNRGVKLAKASARKWNKKRNFSKRTIWKDKLFEKYSHLGRRNFVSYGIRASKIMDSPYIRQQIKPLWNRLNSRIKTAEIDLY